MKPLWFIFLCVLTAQHAIGQTVDNHKLVYVFFNNHIEGDGTSRPGDLLCPSDTTYQTLPVPPIGNPNLRTSFAIDLFGTRLLCERTNQVADSYGDHPNLTYFVLYRSEDRECARKCSMAMTDCPLLNLKWDIAPTHLILATRKLHMVRCYF